MDLSLDLNTIRLIMLLFDDDCSETYRYFDLPFCSPGMHISYRLIAHFVLLCIYIQDLVFLGNSLYAFLFAHMLRIKPGNLINSTFHMFNDKLDLAATEIAQSFYLSHLTLPDLVFILIRHGIICRTMSVWCDIFFI